jgi:hypothetical protein
MNSVASWYGKSENTNGTSSLLRGLSDARLVPPWMRRVYYFWPSLSSRNKLRRSKPGRDMLELDCGLVGGPRAEVQVNGIACYVHLHHVQDVDLHHAIRYGDVNIVVAQG